MASSSSETGRASGFTGAAQFSQTRWSMVLSAAGKKDTGLARQSLEQLCCLYWRPLYAYIRRQGASPHDAQDLTQEFFARLLERESLRSVDPRKGRFRSFLLAALKHFLSNERDKARARKRGGGHAPLPLDFAGAESACVFQPADALTPDKIFDQRWAMALLDQSLARLREEYSAQGKELVFDQLKITLTEGRGSVAYAELSARLKMSEDAVKMAVHRLRKRYREVLRAGIAETVADESEIEDELRHVMGAFAR